VDKPSPPRSPFLIPTKKTPPRVPPPVYRREVFAHLLAMDCACPGCGAVYAGPQQQVRRAARKRRQGKRYMRQSGYSPLTGRFTCVHCDRVWIVGVIFWPVHSVSRPGRAVDTVPTLEEALQLREHASRVGLVAVRDSKAPVNVVEAGSPEVSPLGVNPALKDPLLE
jgi:hypothetical protein